MQNNTNLSFWNFIANIYDTFMKKDRKAYDEIYALISRKLISNMYVLELATGTGAISIAIADKVNSVEASDYSSKMIAVAEKKKIPSNVKFSVQDACNLNYDDESFDCVIISNALHIMPNPYLALQNISRVLKNDGLLIAPTFTPKRNDKKDKILAQIMGIFGFKSYHKWNTEQYCEFLEKSGYYIEFKQVLKAVFPITYLEARKRVKENEIDK